MSRSMGKENPGRYCQELKVGKADIEFRRRYVRYWHIADILLARPMSAFGGKADMKRTYFDVRF